MKNTTRLLALVAGVLLAAGSTADAQTAPPPPDVFVNVNVGFQAHSHVFTSTDSFTVYDETATVASTQSVSNGLLFDVSGAYRVLGSLAVGLGVSTFSDSADASMTAVVPDPLVFNSSRTVTAIAEDLARRETLINLQAVIFLPVPDFMPVDTRIALVLGPTIMNVRQELVRSAVVPAGTQDAVPAVETQSKSGIGFNGGFDLTYPINPQYGIGAFLRYAGGKIDLDSVTDLKVGGFQAGFGLRVGF
jgi:hypothetical protein